MPCRPQPRLRRRGREDLLADYVLTVKEPARPSAPLKGWCWWRCWDVTMNKGDRRRETRACLAMDARQKGLFPHAAEVAALIPHPHRHLLEGKREDTMP